MERQTKKPETESEEDLGTQSEDLTQADRVELGEIDRAFKTINPAGELYHQGGPRKKEERIQME